MDGQIQVIIGLNLSGDVTLLNAISSDGNENFMKKTLHNHPRSWTRTGHLSANCHAGCYLQISSANESYAESHMWWLSSLH